MNSSKPFQKPPFPILILGAEFQVLKTIPWSLVDIEMISVETDLAGLIMDGSRKEIIEFMRQNGYIHRFVCGIIIRHCQVEN